MNRLKIRKNRDVVRSKVESVLFEEIVVHGDADLRDDDDDGVCGREGVSPGGPVLDEEHGAEPDCADGQQRVERRRERAAQRVGAVLQQHVEGRGAAEDGLGVQRVVGIRAVVDRGGAGGVGEVLDVAEDAGDAQQHGGARFVEQPGQAGGVGERGGEAGVEPVLLGNGVRGDGHVDARRS